MLEEKGKLLEQAFTFTVNRCLRAGVFLAPQCLGTWETRCHNVVTPAVLGIESRTTELCPQPTAMAFANRISVLLCCKVGDTLSGKDQLLKYAVKDCHSTFPFKLFLYLGCRFLTCKLEPLK